MTASEPSAPRASYLRLAEKSDLDGTREGGLMFWVAIIGGMMLATSMHPMALTSFWVWFALLSMAVGVAWNTHRLVAWAFGYKPARQVTATDAGQVRGPKA